MEGGPLAKWDAAGAQERRDLSVFATKYASRVLTAMIQRSPCGSSYMVTVGSCPKRMECLILGVGPEFVRDGLHLHCSDKWPPQGHVFRVGASLRPTGRPRPRLGVLGLPVDVADG